MDRKLDLAIVDALRSIIDATDYDITYDIHKGDDHPFRKKRVETVRVNITLTRNVPKDR